MNDYIPFTLMIINGVAFSLSYYELKNQNIELYIGNHSEAKLKRENITQKAFSENVGIGGTTMAKLRKNESITTDSICKICDYFRCMPDEIMEFIPEENYPEDIKAKQQAKQEVQNQIQELQAKLKTM